MSGGHLEKKEQSTTLIAHNYRNNFLRNPTVRTFQRLSIISADIQGFAPETFVFVELYLFDTQVLVSDGSKIHSEILHPVFVIPRLMCCCF